MSDTPTTGEYAAPEFDAETAVAMVLPTTAHAKRALRSLDSEGYVVVPKFLLADLMVPPFHAYRRWAQFGDTKDANRMDEWGETVRQTIALLSLSGGTSSKPKDDNDSN